MAAKLLEGSKEKLCGLRNILVGVCWINVLSLQEESCVSELSYAQENIRNFHASFVP